jgi:glutaredoxin 3
MIPSTGDAPGTASVRVEMYRTRYCGYCMMAARLLDQQRVPFTEIDVSGDHERRRWLAQVTGRRTVPQIFIDGRSIGGYDELAALVRRGELESLRAANDP